MVAAAESIATRGPCCVRRVHAVARAATWRGPPRVARISMTDGARYLAHIGRHRAPCIAAHLQKAALLTLRDGLAVAMTRMGSGDVETVRALVCTILHWKELPALHAPLRVPREFRPVAGPRPLWAVGEPARRRRAMRGGGERDSRHDRAPGQRPSAPQAETVVRLAVVTMLGLIVNVVTGGFGMNQLAEADDPPPVRGRLRSLLALWSRRREAAAHERVMSEQSRTRCAAGPRRRHATRGRVAVCPSQ